MPRQDALHRHAQPRQRTAAGVDAFKGTALPGVMAGPEHDGTLVGVYGASKYGACVYGPPGRGVYGQSKYGSGDTYAPTAEDRLKTGRYDRAYYGRGYRYG